MITIRNLTVRYNNEYILKNFSLTLPQRGAVALLGPSGSGKTTLLRILGGLQTPDRGEVVGLEPQDCALLFQENRLLPQLSALDNVALVLPKGQRELARSWLRDLGLAEAQDKPPAQLSGGMQRRLAIARALAYAQQSKAKALLLDEPFQGLDPLSLDRAMAMVFRASQERLLLLVTHRREEAEILCSSILTLDQRPLQLLRQEENCPRLSLSPQHPQGLEEPQTPAGIRICDQVREKELAAKARIYCDVWQSAYRELLDPDYLASLSPESSLAKMQRRARQVHCLLAKEGEEVLGYLDYGPYYGPDLQDCWEIYALNVLPEQQGRGIGSALLKELLRRLQGQRAVVAWVFQGNRPAAYFYRRWGFAYDGGQQILHFGGKPCTELRLLRRLDQGPQENSL